MRIKDLPEETKIGNYKLRIPDGETTQLGEDSPITEGWFVSFHAKPGGWFMSPDPPDKDSRRLIPTYGEPSKILEWEIIE